MFKRLRSLFGSLVGSSVPPAQRHREMPADGWNPVTKRWEPVGPACSPREAPAELAEDPPQESPPQAPPPDLDPDRCVIIPHAAERPGALVIDLHSAVLAVLQRPTHRDNVELRDRLDVVTIRKNGPKGLTFATVIRWYQPGEQPMAALIADPPLAPELPAEALPRMDECVTFQPPEPRK